MTPDDNKAAVRKFFDEVINAGRLDRADGFVTPSYVEHQQLRGAEGRQGIEVAKAFLSMMRVAFPDYRFTVEDLIGEADKVVARVTVTGTHRGEMMGLAPTHQRVRTTGIEVFRLEDGKLTEQWATFDALGMLRQLGMVPIPQAAATPPHPDAPDTEASSTTLIRFRRLLVRSRTLTT